MPLRNMNRKDKHRLPVSESGRNVADIVIAYSPFVNPGQNAYVERSIEILRTLGHVVPLPRTRMILKSWLTGRFGRYDVAISNWEDIWIGSASSGRLSISGALAFLCRIVVLRFCARKTIFVRHDNYPHGLQGRSAKLARWVVDLTDYTFSLVVVHSGADIGRNRIYIPHPKYSSGRSRDLKSPSIHEAYFVAFGRILPYKKLDQLIRAFPSGVKLIIAGPCEDLSYLRSLMQLAKDKNVQIMAKALDEEDASELVSRAKGLIICHNSEDMIVSGSYYFALCNGTPVLALEHRFYRWLLNMEHTPGLFVFRDIDDLCSNLQVVRSVQAPQLLSYAEDEHGDDRVMRAWRRALELVGVL